MRRPPHMRPLQARRPFARPLPLVVAVALVHHLVQPAFPARAARVDVAAAVALATPIGMTAQSLRRRVRVRHEDVARHGRHVRMRGREGSALAPSPSKSRYTSAHGVV